MARSQSSPERRFPTLAGAAQGILSHPNLAAPLQPKESDVMAYNQFTAMQLREAYHLEITEQAGLFAATPLVAISDWLRVTLQKQMVLALRGNTEKARSEYSIAPILAEVYEQMQERVNLFSGVEFNVDIPRGLSGCCDFLFSLSPLTREIEAPVISIVEAKKENINSGIPQCFAELIAA